MRKIEFYVLSLLSLLDNISTRDQDTKEKNRTDFLFLHISHFNAKCANFHAIVRQNRKYDYGFERGILARD